MTSRISPCLMKPSWWEWVIQNRNVNCFIALQFTPALPCQVLETIVRVTNRSWPAPPHNTEQLASTSRQCHVFVTQSLMILRGNKCRHVCSGHNSPLIWSIAVFNLFFVVLFLHKSYWVQCYDSDMIDNKIAVLI